MAKNDIDGVAEFRVRRSKRKIQLTPKALQNAIEAKWRDILRSRGKLLIEKLWAELERRFGSAATITNRPLQKRERTGKEYGCFPFV